MVLTLKRAAYIALVVGMPMRLLMAQQPPAASPSRPGEVRPLLYGFALECIDCAPGEHGRGRGGTGQPPVLSYRTFPHVVAIAPGSAAERAGIRAGDILHTIDGMSVGTDAGAERLAHATAGQQVRLGFERASKPFAVSLVLGAANPSELRGSGPTRIYGGYIALQGSARGATKIKLEVWSDDPIVPDDSTNAIVLRIGTSTLIKLQLTKDSTDSSVSRTSRGGTSDRPENLPLSSPPQQ